MKWGWMISKWYEMKQRSLVSTGEISREMVRRIQTEEEKKSKKDGFCLEKERSTDQRQVRLIKVVKWRDEQRDVDQMGDCSTKQGRTYRKICSQF